MFLFQVKSASLLWKRILPSDAECACWTTLQWPRRILRTGICFLVCGRFCEDEVQGEPPSQWKFSGVRLATASPNTKVKILDERAERKRVTSLKWHKNYVQKGAARRVALG